MRFADIPQFTRSGSYMVHVGLDYLSCHYVRMVAEYGLDVNPPFQRAHVWTRDQKIRFVEYMLRGGRSGLDIYCNSPTWQHGELRIDAPETWFVLVDGKQRLDAALAFINNEIPAFGGYYREFEDKLRLTDANFRWHVNDLATYEEVLQWYLDLNAGGVVHTEDELEKVRDLLTAKSTYTRPPVEEILSNGTMSREVLQEAQAELHAERERRLAFAQTSALKPMKKGRSRK